MKVRLKFGPDANVKVEKDAQGNVLCVELEPTFTKKKGQAVIARCSAATDGGSQLEKFDLVVSGATGKVTKVATTDRSVKAAVDDAKAKVDKEGEKPPAKPPAQTHR